MGVDYDALILTTQESLARNLVYIMNIQDESKCITKDTRNDGMNPTEQDDKKPTARTSPLEKCLLVNRNEDLKDYRESGVDNNPGREKSGKRRRRERKKIYILNSIQMMMWKGN